MVVSNPEAERLHIIGRAVFFSRIGVTVGAKVLLQAETLGVLCQQSVGVPIIVQLNSWGGGRL